MTDRSRIPQFYKYSVPERLGLLRERELLSDEDYQALMDGTHLLQSEDANRLIENVIGTFSLPLGLGLNFLINDVDRVVPLVVEEPSILAALSSSAKRVRACGGFRAQSSEPLLIGQIQVVDVVHPSRTRNLILQNRREILDFANSLHPNMVARGGGARDIEVMIHPRATARGDMVVIHLIVDTCNAMGANLVNTMCEGIAPFVEKITGGTVFLRILSNLTDRSMVRAEATIPVDSLPANGLSGEEVRDGIILANDFAVVDPYRAATHNKGIMNGIDAVAIATGNDWRAIEAAAHAWAGRGHSYTSLTRWEADADGNLVGCIELPLKVGTVGGPMQSNPAVQIMHRLMRVDSARELAEIMASVGLAQNLSALRALSTEGIQRGHMTLHARSVAVAAGAPPEIFESVVERLIEGGDIKVWKAKEAMHELEGEGAPLSRADQIEARATYAAGHGKVILIGEHAVVYGSHAVAAPIPLAVQARCEARKERGTQLLIPRYGVEENIRAGAAPSNVAQQSVALILDELGVRDRDLTIEVYPHVPRAMGLGASAALAVAVIRAVARHSELELSDQEVNRIAFGCETLIHGKASGVDNTLATFGQFIVFQKGDPPKLEPITVRDPIPIVIGMTGVESLTAKTVAHVAKNRDKNPGLYERIFAEIDSLALQSIQAIGDYDLERLGELMNVCQGLLNALQVSSWELEELVQIARHNGALGAKLTGGGGGGSIVALCPPNDRQVPAKVADGMRKAGYRAMTTEIG